MGELADPQGREPCARKGVEVRVFSAAPVWSRVRVVYRARLESVYTRKGLVGSNPTGSASSNVSVRRHCGNVAVRRHQSLEACQSGLSSRFAKPVHRESGIVGSNPTASARFGRVLSTATTTCLENRRTERCRVRLPTLPPVSPVSAGAWNPFITGRGRLPLPVGSIPTPGTKFG